MHLGKSDGEVGVEVLLGSIVRSFRMLCDHAVRFLERSRTSQTAARISSRKGHIDSMPTMKPRKRSQPLRGHSPHRRRNSDHARWVRCR